MQHHKRRGLPDKLLPVPTSWLATVAQTTVSDGQDYKVVSSSGEQRHSRLDGPQTVGEKASSQKSDEQQGDSHCWEVMRLHKIELLSVPGREQKAGTRTALREQKVPRNTGNTSKVDAKHHPVATNGDTRV